MKITNKKILIFISVGLCLALIASVAISKRLSVAVIKDVESREIETIFSAIESGPLAIARMQSSDIAQEELNRLMSHPQITNRGIVGVSIFGGENFSFKFAEWISSRKIDPLCSQSLIRSFLPQDSIDGFRVNITVDRCYIPSEEKEIFIYSIIAGSLVAIIGMILLGFSLWPVASSIRKAELAIGNNNTNIAEEISFLPIQALASKAVLAIELEREAAFASLAAQVSHDIRSPLSALNMVLAATQEIPEEKKEIIRNASNRINSIANLLLQKRKVVMPGIISANSDDMHTFTDLHSTANSVLKEKIALFGHRIDFQFSIGMSLSEYFIRIDPIEIGRILSNLLNNSVEAISGNGKISVSASVNREYASIVIVDSGKGISSENLEKIGTKGFSSGKNSIESGAGLGVYHAKQTILAARGKFSIHSRENEGTIVTIVLPCVKRSGSNCISTKNIN